MTSTLRKKARLLLLDDHPILLQGISQTIRQTPGLSVMWEGGEPSNAWKALEREQPDLAIVDLSLRGSDGLEFVKNVHAHWPKLPILVLSMHDEGIYADRVIRAGAKGYIMKSESGEHLLKAIQQVLAGDLYLSDFMKNKMLQRSLSGRRSYETSPMERLSDRELEVFQMIGRGQRTRQIAESLHLSVKTIETYRAHIMDKLGLERSTDLVMHAFHWVQGELKGEKDGAGSMPDKK